MNITYENMNISNVDIYKQSCNQILKLTNRVKTEQDLIE